MSMGRQVPSQLRFVTYSLSSETCRARPATPVHLHVRWAGGAGGKGAERPPVAVPLGI